MAFDLFKRSVNTVKYKKQGDTYKFSITFKEKEIIQFLSLVVGNSKSINIKGKTLEFIVDKDETTAGQFIDFARTSGLIK